MLCEEPDCVMSQQGSRWHRCLSLEVAGPRAGNVRWPGPLAGPNPASGPYINHHMSSCFINVYSLSHCPWRLSGRKLILIFCITKMLLQSLRSDFRSLALLIYSTLLVICVLSSVKHCRLSLSTFWLCLWWCVQFKVRNVFSCQAAFRLWDLERRLLWNATYLTPVSSLQWWLCAMF